MKKVILTLLCLIIGTLLTQGFQCASPEMTTAKLAINNRDWDKARTNLEKETGKNPKNIEAWVMLAQVYQQTGNLIEAASTIRKAEKNTDDEKVKAQLNVSKGNIWAACYNLGIDFVNRYNSTNRKDYLDSAINHLKLAIDLKPEFPNTYSIIGTAYELLGNSDKSIESFIEYTKVVKPNIDFAKEKGLHFDKPRADVIKLLGNPIATKGKRYSPEQDSILIDLYKINDKELYLFSVINKEGNTLIYGWKYDQSPNLSQAEREQPLTITTSPFATLATHYYDKKDYQKAIENVQIITLLEPYNTDANNFLVQIYDTQGKKDDAINYIASLVKKDPNNKMYRAQYGDILLRVERYDDAIEQYEAALKLDPTFYDVTRNLAASYKNKAVVIQKKQQEQMDKDKNFKPNLEEYFPLLRKSAEYFESARKSPKYEMDVEVLAELISIYDVTDNKEKLKVRVAELEAVEFQVPDEQKERYYLTLLKIYDRTRNTVKSQEVQDKLNKLNK